MVIGEKFAGYTILGSCGKGAFGEVYLVEDMLGRHLAMKVVPVFQAGEAELEALRGYSKLPPHPAICQIYQFGIENGLLFYYTMELADNALGANSQVYEADTLASRMKDHRQIPIDEALTYCQTILDALEFLHEHGFTHRDIKPENIIFVNGQLKIADFGLLADISKTLSLAGTLGFLPPEVLKGEHVKGALCDVYAVGKILYSSVTGKDPTEYPALPGNLAPESLRRLCVPVAKICSHNPENRCGTCRECHAILAEAAQGDYSPMKGFLARLKISPALQRCVACGIMAFFMLIAGGILGGHKYFERQRALHAQAQEKARHDLQEFQRIAVKLPLQCPEFPTEELLAKLMNLLDADDLPEFNRALQAEQERFRGIAEERIPSLELTDSYTENQGVLTKFYSYYRSPLFYFLSDERQQELKSAGNAAAKECYRTNQCPKIGQDYRAVSWTEPPYWHFVAPQAYRSPTTNQVKTIDYPFWVFDDKITNEIYYKACRAIDTRNLQSQYTDFANKLNWNDMLNFCYGMSTLHLNSGDFPKGYGIRIPTEEEWELLATGGWSPYSNPFSLKNILLPPLEAVTISPGTLPKGLAQDTYYLRGKRFKNDDALTFKDLTYRDTWFVRDSGLRPVLAPMDANYYQSQWYPGSRCHTARVGGKVYSAHITSITTSNYTLEKPFLELLHARFPEPTSPQHLKEIYDGLEIINHYLSILGIKYEDGTWRYLSNRQEVGWDVLPSLSDENTKNVYLKGNGRGDFTNIDIETNVPTLLLEWTSEDDYAKRLDWWKEIDKSPILTSVTIGKHKYAILWHSFYAQEVEAVAELMGTKCATFSTDEKQKQLLEMKLFPNKKIFIGAHRDFQNVMVWNDGTRVSVKNKQIDEVPNDRIYVCSKSLDGFGIYNGELHYLFHGDGVLLNIPTENYDE